MIFITGDIHGEHDLKKFGKQEFPIQSKLTRRDYMIICGDFGLIWNDSQTERYWLRWLDSKPWTTLWIDGNHENYNLLKRYRYEEWRGGTIQKITPHIYHLCRGDVFELDNKKIFAFGGAESHDKQFRIPGKTIWKEEMPSADEMQHGLDSLELHNWKADIVVTHSLPSCILKDLGITGVYSTNPLTDYFENISEKLNFNMWFSGHYHMYRQCTPKHYMIFKNIAQIKGRSFELV